MVTTWTSPLGSYLPIFRSITFTRVPSVAVALIASTLWGIKVLPNLIGSVLCLPLDYLVSPYSMAINGNTLTVYEVLEEYNFPVGVLPKGVTSYELDRSTGKFSVHLNQTCTFSVDGYKLEYKTKISGVITNETLKDLSGVQVKILFIWLSIREVTREGDKLDFSVGISSADFSVENFLESPQCGCGFDCANLVGSYTLPRSLFAS